jgi:two-component system, OmpR family, sensor kinase
MVMYLPLQIRLTLFFTLILGLALWFFGQTVYTQTAQRAYSDLDATLSSRAASVQLGKFFVYPNNLPSIIPSSDGLGAGGVAIEVLDSNLSLISTTAASTTDFTQTSIEGLVPIPVPWDKQAAEAVLRRPYTTNNNPDSIYRAGNANSMFSTITFQGQRVRVYTLANNNFDQVHIIQTALSEQSIEQSLSDLRSLLLRVSVIVLAFALVGGWLITWGLLFRARRITKTAQKIGVSRNFNQRVPDKTWLGRDELSILATTFNEMLTNLEDLYQQQQRFVADASHELRAPITSIRCNLDLLAKAPDLPPQEVQDAQAETDRMGRLINDLLMLTRADSVQQTDNRIVNGYKKHQDQQVDLDSLLLEVFRQHQPSRENGYDDGDTRQNRPRLLLQHITPVRVNGDSDQLKQVLIALLDNALKYTPYEGSVSLSLTTSGDQAIVKVSDTGIGISPDDVPHIFERFYRADRARSRDRGGSGLGLAIVKRYHLNNSG